MLFIPLYYPDQKITDSCSTVSLTFSSMQNTESYSNESKEMLYCFKPI